MAVHKLITNNEQHDRAVASAEENHDSLVLRSARGDIWTWLPEHNQHAPEEGWASRLDPEDFPFLVLWTPGDQVVPIENEAGNAWTHAKVRT